MHGATVGGRGKHTLGYLFYILLQERHRVLLQEDINVQLLEFCNIHVPENRPYLPSLL
jgi:hypothetical protein